ncbi:RelA/SpoT domain-containing protein [Glaciimonas sp. GG7]
MEKMYSGKAVARAGEKLVDEELIKRTEEYSAAMDVLSYWRFSHEKPLDVAFNMLQKITNGIDKSAIFAKRLKRYVSIVSKLRRFDQMKLKNMQDIGGCRAIVKNEKKLRQIVKELRKQSSFKNSEGKIRAKDYIKYPKEDGYRGYHLIGQFSDGYSDKRSIEFQVRTVLQHDWATTLEIVDLFTGQALKSNRGEADWKNFFRHVSKQFSIMEGIHLFDALDDHKKFVTYQELVFQRPDLIESCRDAQKFCKNLGVVNTLQAYAQSLKVIDDRLNEMPINGYALIEVDTPKKQVSSTLFSDDMNAEAEERYTKAEKAAATSKGLVIALVSTTAVGGLKEAYPNYFADSTEFVKYLLFITNVVLPKSTAESWLNFWKLFDHPK